MTVTVEVAEAPITTPYTAAFEGSRCKTTWSVKAPEKKVPAVVLGKFGNELPGENLWERKKKEERTQFLGAHGTLNRYGGGGAIKQGGKHEPK